MRLLFIIDCLGSGGAQRQMVNLAVGLKRRGHEIAFFLYYPEHDFFAPALQQNDIVIHAHKKAWRFSVGPAVALRSVMKKWTWDAGLAFLPTPSFYAEMARLGLRSFRLIVSERFTYTSSRLPLSRFLSEQMHRFADHITVNSHHQRLLMEQIFPWMRGKLTTIYNGVDLDEFTPAIGPFASNKRCLTLLALSSVVPKKNAIGLVRALAAHRELYGGRCTVHWAGKITTDGVSQKEFRDANRLLKELSLENQWVWLGEREDVPALLRQCDALIHPSYFEGLPNAVCEALASGQPVLASDVCDNARLVQEGTTGFLFNPAQPADIARAIFRLAQLSDEARLAMGQNSRSWAERELSLEGFCERYERLFESITCHPKGILMDQQEASTGGNMRVMKRQHDHV